MAQNLYGPGVRMGNWNEDVYLEEELMKDFLAKRDKGQLLIQRNRRLKENLLRPMQLSISEDGYIRYGDKVMLVNPDRAETEADLFLGGDLSLCMTPDEIKAHLSDELEVPCGLSAAQTKIPVGRNTFTILCAAGEVIGQVLRYGQNFRLGIAGGFADRMANAKILINHCHTNRGLVAHRHLFLSTYFGKEAEVAAHTYLDSHRVEKPKNHWMLVTGNPRKDSSTMLDLPKPLAEDTRVLEQVAEPGARNAPGAHACTPPT
ncbi:cilia- and flagella-associated protein 161 [Physeter macrocephalus]|uniref:Cilia- and flagella-associated protein 161 n=1 Tax=Physeter macrocephalus TaxID=9755 RepID=A0A2Y9FP82_PHYMC|nr:cilia- and flagella-associated protein 161 [Physeter catodon]|eukprot:XP_007126407.2 cilia- and flagella-associated protein 161 [Physeter catodon]